MSLPAKAEGASGIDSGVRCGVLGSVYPVHIFILSLSTQKRHRNKMTEIGR